MFRYFKAAAAIPGAMKLLMLPNSVRRGSATGEFLERYVRAFAGFDAEAIADLFVYPCQLTSHAGETR
jgi:hypothetical protein